MKMKLLLELVKFILRLSASGRFVLFDKLYAQDRTSEIGEAAMLQSVLVLYDVKEIDRAEQRILTYLEEQPDGQYARTLLSLMMRDNLVKQNSMM